MISKYVGENNIKVDITQSNKTSVFKYYKPDCDTIAIEMKRDALEGKLRILELSNNCLFFFFGYDRTQEMVYVGKTDGSDVITYIKNYLTELADEYDMYEGLVRKLGYDHPRCAELRAEGIWDSIVIVTDKNDNWTSDDIDALYNIFHNNIPSDSLIGVEECDDDVEFDSEAYTDIVEQIKEFINVMGFTVFSNN